jgi:acetoin utilization protein AcuB
MKPPLLKNLMTPFPYSVARHAPIGEARMLMLKHHIRHLPVTDGSQLVGVITDRDIKLFLGPELGNPDPVSSTVEDAYLADCYVVDIHTQVLPVLKHMAEKHVGSAIVTSKGRIAGIFTFVDVCRAFAEHLQTQFYLHSDDPPDIA